MSDSYRGKFRCVNCSWEGHFDIPKGTTKNGFTKTQKCPTCGTLSLSVSLY